MRQHAAESLSALIESTEDLIWSVDLDHRLTNFNSAFQEHFIKNFGIPPAVGLCPQELPQPADAAHWPPLYARALSGEKFRTEFSLLDGRLLELTFNAIVVDGERIGVSVFGKDITEQKAAEESRRFLAALVESSDDAIAAFAPSGAILTWNRGAEVLLGYMGNEVIGNDATILLAPDRRKELQHHLQTVLAGYTVDPHQTVVRRKDGCDIDVSLTLSAIRNPTGEVVGASAIARDITEHKRLDRELREADKRYRDIFDGAIEGMFQTSPEFRILAASRAFAEMLGYDSPEEMQFTIANVIEEVWADPGEYARFKQQIAENRAVRYYEARFKRKDGATIWGSLSCRRVCAADGRPLYTDGFLENITERKRAEMQLRDSEERYRATFDQAAVGMVHSAFGGRIIRCNKRYAEILGYAPEEVLNLTYQQITWPEDIAECEATVERLWNCEVESASWEKRYVRKDGVVVWVKLTSSLQRDGEGRILHLLTLVEDIDDRKQAEARLLAAQKALLASETRYRTVFETSPDAISITRWPDGQCDDINPSFLDSMGYRREELVGRTTQELGIWANPEDREAFFATLRRESSIRDFEAQFRRKDGKLLWGRTSASNVELNGIPCILSVTQDISEAKAAAAEVLRVSEERLWLVQQLGGIGTFETELPSGRLRISRQMAEILGLASDELEIGIEGVPRVFHPEDRSLFEAQHALLAVGNPIHFEFRIVRPGGEVRWLEVSAKALLDNAGKPIRGIGAAFDITGRKQIENRLRLSEEQLRALAARLQTANERERLRIAQELHDQLGSTLTGMKMDLDWMLRKRGEGGEEWVSAVQNTINSIDSTIAQVRRIATGLRPELLDAVGLPAAIEWHTEQFQRRTGILCAVHVHEALVSLSNDREIAVFRIFQEAMTNIARHSRAKSVLVTLEQNKTEAILAISDNGAGFALDSIEQKTSLGVLGMRERARFLGAQCCIESAPGAGTTITVRIPLEDTGPGSLEDDEGINC
jgi:PAS domain S-box-containing protein